MTFPGSQSAASDSRAATALLIADFESAGAYPGWYVVNDNVMGGRSEGDFSIDRGELRFAGRTNTDGGGFSSIRAAPLQLDLSAHAGIRLRVKGDGRRYTWRLATGARWRGQEIGYWADFETQESIWTTVDIPFSRFVPRYRGTRLDGPELDTQAITGMGLMIYDKLDGPFDVRIATIAAYSPPRFSLEQYQWKNRIVVISAPTMNDEDLARVRTDMAATSTEFEDRQLVAVTLLEEGASTAGSNEIAAADAATLRATLSMPPGHFGLRLIGKDGSVKFSSDAAVAMSEIYGIIDAMPMRQREISDR